MVDSEHIQHSPCEVPPLQHSRNRPCLHTGSTGDVPAPTSICPDIQLSLRVDKQGEGPPRPTCQGAEHFSQARATGGPLWIDTTAS